MTERTTDYYTIYGKANCSGCEQAKALLEAKGIGYEYVDVMKSATAMTLFRENAWKSVPQIMKNESHVGGFEQLKKEFE